MYQNIYFDTEVEYRDYFKKNYCDKDIFTHDGINVTFHEDMFDHAFYTRSKRSLSGEKDVFSRPRCERMKWIKDALSDESIPMKSGYDNYCKRYDNNRRVAYVADDYVVIIKLFSEKKARFITAFIIDNDDTKDKIASSPDWVNPF